ncbi:MAG: DinB family protein [Bacteroidota bacterium]
MINEQSTKTELLAAIALPVHAIIGFATPLTNEQLNQVPYPNSWTAAQLMDHVTKSMSGMAQVTGQKGKPAGREPGEKIAELKKTFLDMTTKMQSPEEIVPGEGPFKKEESIAALNKALLDLTDNSEGIEVNELLEGLPFGPVTKLELLHFTLYHTARHSYQMKRICDKLSMTEK